MIELSHLLAEVSCKVVRQRRTALSLSQEALSQRTGLARSYISDVERGERHPTLHNLTIFSEALEWSPSQLVQESEFQLILRLDPDRLLTAGPQLVGLTDLERDIVRYMNVRMPHGIIIANKEGRFAMFNQAATALTGVGMQDALPEEWSGVYGCFRPDRVTRMETGELPLVQALSGTEFQSEKIFLRNPGIPEGKYLDVIGKPITDPNSNRPKGAMVFFSELPG